VKQAILAAGFSVSAGELGARHGVSDATVHAIRNKAGLRKSEREKPARPAKAAAPKPAHVKSSTALAVARPAAPAPLSIALEGVVDEARLDAIFGRLSAGQKAVAIEAAIKSLLGAA
jgi:hypothetical protein